MRNINGKLHDLELSIEGRFVIDQLVRKMKQSGNSVRYVDFLDINLKGIKNSQQEIENGLYVLERAEVLKRKSNGDYCFLEQQSI